MISNLKVFKNKKILITGDTGFKGSWLAIWLLHLGADIIGYSLKPRSHNDNYVVCGLEKQYQHINGDVLNYDNLIKVFSHHQPEIVFHLAAQAIVLDSYQEPLNTFQTNVLGTANVLEAIRKTPAVQAAIIVTSDKCYENKEWIYGYRETDALGGKDPYSASKGACEIITSSYLRSFFSDSKSANIATVRAGNVMGGGDWAPNRIVPDCIRAIIDEKPVLIRNPAAVRPWQHVLEPISGYLKLASFLYTDNKEYRGAWNFGPLNNSFVTVYELVEELCKQWGNGQILLEQNNNYKNKNDNSNEANLLHLDISKAVNVLKWLPVFDLDQAIQLSVAGYKVNNMNPVEVFQNRINQIDYYVNKIG